MRTCSKLIKGVSSLFFPVALCGGQAYAVPSYQRSYLSAGASQAQDFSRLKPSLLQAAQPVSPFEADARDLAVFSGAKIRELVVVDGAVADKHLFYRAMRPGVDVVEIDSSQSGIEQLKKVLSGYKDLAVVRLVSHAENGSILLGDSYINAERLQQDLGAFTALNGAIKEGGDLLLYGCELAKDAEGEALLDIIKHNTHIDVAASNDLTGNAQLGGDWELEIRRGDINASPLADSVALRDFSSVLAVSFSMGLGGVVTYGSYVGAGNNAQVHEDGGSSYTLTIDGQSDGTFVNGAYVYLGGGGASRESAVILSVNGGQLFTPSSIYLYSSVGVTFTITSNLGGSVTSNYLSNSGQTVNLSSLPANISSITISGSNNFSGRLDNVVFSSIVSGDVTPPTVTAVSSSTANGSYKVGDVVSVTVNFNEAVTVTGTPQLTLETGVTDRVVNYVSGSGTTALTFNYTVQAGDTSADLDYVATNSLALNAGTIKDAAGNNAILTLASPGAAGSLGANKAIVVDGVAPAVSSVTSSTANGTYTVGDAVSIQVNFSEVVTVTGTPQLTLETGATDRTVNYSSGNGTSTLTFSYTIQAGDTSSDLDYVAINSLALNGGTIRDAATNNATLTLPSPGAAGSLGANKAIVVNGAIVPTVGIVIADTALLAGETSLVTFTFSEAVTGFTNADLAIANGTLSSVSSSDGGVTWTATLTPTASITDATNVITVDMTGVSSVSTSTPGAGTTSSSNYAIDTLRPTATVVVADTALAIGETSTVTITFNEAVVGLTTADFMVASGDLSGLSSGDGGVTWTATLTPSTSITDSSNIITLDNTGMQDSSGNTGTGTTDSNNYAVDTLRPTATVVVADTALAIGETSQVIITFSEAVSGFTNADLTVANGTLSPVSSDDGGVTWTATLTPAASITDSSNVITLANTGVTDAAGNTGAGTTDSNNYAVDTVRPTATVVVADTALSAGETSLVTITFSEAVTGFTNADLTIANGTLSGVTTGDGGVTWTATLTPTASLEDASNLITLDNTGVQDAAGNTGTGTTDSNNYAIDTMRPTTGIVVTDTALAVGETTTVTFTFNESVTGFTIADMVVANGVVTGLSSGDGGITWTATLTPTAGLEDASNLIILDNTGVQDAGGNAGSGTTDSNNYAIDTLRPTALIVVADAMLSYGETSLVTITFNEPVTGFDNADLAVANGVLASVSSGDGGITWTALFTPTSGINVASNLITLGNAGVQDLAGNAGVGTTDSNNYVIDTIPLDTDGDGYDDTIDAFPNDPTEWEDTDGDGLGDNSDPYPLDPVKLNDEEGSASNEWYGASVAMADMNADGFADLLVGAPYRKVMLASRLRSRVGAIDIISGKDGALLNTLNGSVANQRFGTAIAVVDDQDTDGVPDIVVGNPYANGVGNVSLYSGADGALLQSIVDGEAKAGGAGCPVPPCTMLGLGDKNQLFGASVAVGDVDNDGNDDLIVGAPKADVDSPVKLVQAGGVIVYDGLSSTVLYSRAGTQARERFGASVAFNAADGQLLVGSSHFDVLVPKRLANAGQVQVFDASNGSSQALVTVTGSAAKEYFGSAVGSFDGDIDGDTATDWVVGAPGALVASDKMGKVHMFSGAGTVPFASREGFSAKGYFGKALCANGDLNADATNDLVIGAPRESVQGPSGKAMPKTGVVRVYSGAKLP